MRTAGILHAAFAVRIGEADHDHACPTQAMAATFCHMINSVEVAERSIPWCPKPR
jgi:hypothetical protein